MDKQIVKRIMDFMMTVELKGHEVPEFNIVMNALHSELNRENSTQTNESKESV